MPIATSEVVIAANSNYANVIIKGIDPRSVGDVTDLDENVEEKQALERLWPLADDGGVLGVPDAGAAPSPERVPDAAVRDAAEREQAVGAEPVAARAPAGDLAGRRLALGIDPDQEVVPRAGELVQARRAHGVRTGASRLGGEALPSRSTARTR